VLDPVLLDGQGTLEDEVAESAERERAREREREAKSPFLESSSSVKRKLCFSV